LFLASLTLVFCSNGDVDESLKVKKRRTKSVPLSEVKAEKTGKSILKITDIIFDKLVDVENDISAVPVLSDKDASSQFIFSWFVNDKEIPGEKETLLSREYFRENDWVYCRVKIDDPKVSFPEFLSKRIRIKGPLPELNLEPPEEFKPPGIFRYKINAKMPDVENFEPNYDDEDEIDPEKSVKFELISPVDKGIIINPLTGEITWNITKELLSELGEKIKIKFSVISPSGRKISSSISLTLKEREGNNNNPDNNSTLGTEIE